MAGFEVAAAMPDDSRVAELHTEMVRLAASTLVATRCGSAVGGPIACMENDHALAERSLRRLRALTDDYTASAMTPELLLLRRTFDRELREHMYKENEALFPRALQAQQSAGRAARSQLA